jgi:hypothetical protein
MSDAHEAMSVFLATQSRVDEVLSSVHSLANQVEIIGERMDHKISAVEMRLLTLEHGRGGSKKPFAVAAGVGGGAGFFSALASSGLLEFLGTVLKKFGL